MKKLRFLIGFAILLLTAARLGYVMGQRQYRDFEAMCTDPDVQCVVRFAPQYLESHNRVAMLPHIWGELWYPASGDGRMQ